MLKPKTIYMYFWIKISFFSTLNNVFESFFNSLFPSKNLPHEWLCPISEDFDSNKLKSTLYLSLPEKSDEFQLFCHKALKKMFKICQQVFNSFYLPPSLKERLTPQLNKIKFSLLWYDLYHIWIELAWRFWRESPKPKTFTVWRTII